MCDYSLHYVASRPAKIEDKLVVTEFDNSFTRGFAAVGEPHVAVCLLRGTEIAFEENVECEPSFGIGILPNKKISQRLARFRQINLDNAVTHHDALEFPDGQVILLTRLCEGQRATVLQLPAAPRTAEIPRGYLMARSAAPKRTWNATVSKRLSKKVSGKPFPLQMPLLVVQPALLEPHKDYTSRSKG
jgi:hypothetical protein